jgi:hypothetical protein
MEERTHNGRFCEMAGGVIVRATVLGIAGSGSPNGSAVEPPLRKAAVTLYASGGQRSETMKRKLKV